jgi:hypothetical protein
LRLFVCPLWILLVLTSCLPKCCLWPISSIISSQNFHLLLSTELLYFKALSELWPMVPLTARV